MKRARAIDEIFHTRGNIAKVVGGAQNNAVGIKHLLLQFVHVIADRAHWLKQALVAASAKFNVQLGQIDHFGFGA